MVLVEVLVLVLVVAVDVLAVVLVVFNVDVLVLVLVVMVLILVLVLVVVVDAVAVVLVVIVDVLRLIVHNFWSEHKLFALSDCISAPLFTKSVMAAGSPFTVTITTNWGVCALERRRRDPTEGLVGFAVIMS